jgi:hypothetical protein
VGWGRPKGGRCDDEHSALQSSEDFSLWQDSYPQSDTGQQRAMRGEGRRGEERRSTEGDPLLRDVCLDTGVADEGDDVLLRMSQRVLCSHRERQRERRRRERDDKRERGQRKRERGQTADGLRSERTTRGVTECRGSSPHS